MPQKTPRRAEPLRLDERYRHFHKGFLRDRRFSFLYLLIFWPLYGLCFLLLERGGFERTYVSVRCPLDDLIPFSEWALLPYLFWFVYLVGMFLYAGLCEVDLFRKMMYYTILTYSFTVLVYLLYPTQQDLRPACFPRDNVLTRLVGRFYAFDTNTNVCPSLHVIGSGVVQNAAWNSKRFGTPGWRIAFTVAAAAICLSTVFLKQHSALDILWAIPVCCAAYLPIYGIPNLRERRAARSAAGESAA